MPLLPKVSCFFRNLLSRGSRDRQLDEELESYVEHLAEKMVRSGLSTQEARRQALIELGGKETMKEKIRERGIGHGFDTLLQDIRYGLRMLRRNPGFTAVAVLTLALGIGANTAMFSVLNGVVLQPPAYPDADRVVLVFSTYKDRYDHGVLSPGMYYDWKDIDGIFDALSPVAGDGKILTGRGEPVELNGKKVAPEFFQVVGVPPVLGRSFTEEESIPGQDKVIVLTHGLWQERFGGDKEALGEQVTLNGDAYTVVGVLPASFRYPGNPRYWIPAAATAEQKNARDYWFLGAVGRLKAGVTPEQASLALTNRLRQLEEKHRQYKDRGANVVPIHENQIRRVKSNLWMLQGAVGFVLLIACVNVANLLLSRAAAREKEFSIRAALGAHRGRLLRQMLTESLLLASVGCLLGVLLAWIGVKLFITYTPPFFPRVEEISIDFTVLGYSLAVTLLTGLFFGLAPALQSGRTNLVEVLKGGGRTAGGGTGWRQGWLRNGLVVTEIALAMVLLVGAGLLVRSFSNLLGEQTGFESDKLLTARITLPTHKYPGSVERREFFEAVLGRLHLEPQVINAAGISTLPFSQWDNWWLFQLPEIKDDEGNPTKGSALFDTVTPAYFQTLGIPLLRGRFFSPRDDAQAPPAAIVSESFVAEFFEIEDPLGKTLRIGNTDRVIVGVVGDVRHVGLDTEPEPTFYIPFAQQPSRTLMLVARTGSSTAALAQAIRTAVRTLDPGQPVQSIATMEGLISQSVATPRFYMLLLTIFAALAAVLAAVGIYGVMAYSVSQRTHEIGIRMALGANRNNVLKLILNHGAVLAAIGVTLGLAGAWALTRYIQSLVYEITATDPATFAGIALLLLTASLLACFLPARRALKVDPMVALRYE